MVYKELDLEKVKGGANVALRIVSFDSEKGGIKVDYRDARVIGDIDNDYSVVFAYQRGLVEFAGMAKPNGEVYGDRSKTLLIAQIDRIPFTIGDYKEGDKVVDKDGNHIDILTTKARGECPIVGQYQCEDAIHTWSEERAKITLEILKYGRKL